MSVRQWICGVNSYLLLLAASAAKCLLFLGMSMFPNLIYYHGKGNLFTESNIQLFYQLFLGNTNSSITAAAATDLISQMTCSEKYLQNPLYARSHFQDFLGGPENGTPTAHDRNMLIQLNNFSSPCNWDFSFEHQHAQTLIITRDQISRLTPLVAFTTERQV